MPSAEYYRKQAQVCAKLALGSTDPSAVSRYHVMLLEHLAKAKGLEPSPDPIERLVAADSSRNVDRG